MVPGLLRNAIFRTQISKIPQVSRRYKSVRAAIERGIRGSGFYSRIADVKYGHRTPTNPNIPPRSVNKSERPVRPAALGPPPFRDLNTARGVWEERTGRQVQDDRDAADKDSREITNNGFLIETTAAKEETRYSRPDRSRTEVARTKQRGPESLPYTTAASEFLYGFSSVQAAIRARRRRLFHLYIHNRGRNNEGSAGLVARAKEASVTVHEVGDEYLQSMDKASSGRPHNGFILEASPLPQPPIVALGNTSIDSSYFSVELDKQSREDARVNGLETQYTYGSAGWRHPLLLYVDEVLDPGNLGAIARSAYFLGVDAIATPTRQSAPWSHIAVKASAGAAEALPVFSVNRPAEFLSQSARAGWRIYASDAITSGGEPLTTSHPSPAIEDPASASCNNIVFTYARSAKRLPPDHCPVDSHPTILMMGGEGTGLRSSLLNSAHYTVGIRAGRRTDDIGMDSLNVSAAASLLCSEFLKRRKPARKTGDWLF